MPCSLTSKLQSACSTGIARVRNPIKLLQLIAQSLCSVAANPPDPYDGLLVYTRQGLGTFTEALPVGARNLTFGANPVTEIHCHNCPGLTSVTCNNSPVLTLVDLKTLAGLTTLSFTGCATLDRVDIVGITSLSGGVTCENSLLLRIFTAPNLATTGGINLRTATTLNLQGSVSFPALVTCSGDFFIYANNTSTGITSISAPLLQTVGGYVIIANHSNMIGINFSSIIATGNDLNISGCPLLVSESFPNLTDVVGSFYFNSNTSMLSISVPSLEMVGGFILGEGCSSLTSVAFPSLLAAGSGFYFSNCSSLISISAPNLASTVLYTEILNSPNFSNLAFTNTMGDFSEFYMSGCSLSQSCVNNLIQGFTNISAVAITADFSGGTSSPPDAARVAQVVVLNSNGCNISTN